MKNNIKIGAAAFIMLLSAGSCSNDFVDTQFYQSLPDAPLASINEMNSFILGAYASMRNTSYYGADFIIFGEARSDEMFGNLAGGYYTNIVNYSQTSGDGYANDTYNRIYEMVAKVNRVIGVDINTLPAADRQKALYAQGQAYALRAMAFFDAFRLYGQKYVPGGTGLGIVLPLKYDPTALQPRATIADTETQIDADFQKGLQLMTANGAVSSVKTELTINSLKGLMSRFYLYKGDYAKVRTYTNDIVTTGGYSVASRDLLQVSYRYALNGASTNSIFELAVGTTASLGTGSLRQRYNSAGYATVVVSDAAYNSYAANDVRRSLITPLASTGFKYLSYLTTNNGIGKYTQTGGADNVKMLRYEEILLNGVEAELNGGSAAKALTYYKNILRERLADIKDGSGNITQTVQQQMDAITSVNITMLKAERMKELIGEGLRQWDLRRWGDPVPRAGTAKTDPNLNAFPIPRKETDLANSPILPNPGYDNSK